MQKHEEEKKVLSLHGLQSVSSRFGVTEPLISALRKETMYHVSIEFYITQVILAFWLVLAYDLLEDRCMIGIIITKFFSLCLKMVESFRDLDNTVF